MKKYVFIIVTVAVMAALLGMAQLAGAQANRTEIEFYEYDCTTDWGTDWTEGNVWHIRDIVHTNISLSASPEVNGISVTVADADFNLLNGNAVIRGTQSLQPDGIAGTWEGTWTFIANKGVYFGRAVAQGTGALKGKTLFMDLYDAAPADDAVEVCATVGGEPHGFTYGIGYILEH